MNRWKLFFIYANVAIFFFALSTFQQEYISMGHNASDGGKSNSYAYRGREAACAYIQKVLPALV